MASGAKRKKTRLWGRVAYIGEAFAAADGTYSGVSLTPLNFAPTHDAGTAPLANLHPAEYGHMVPLIVASLWESAFALETGGPLSTWSN